MIEILQNRDNIDKIEFIARDGEELLGRIAGKLGADCGTFVIDELSCDERFTDALVRAILNLMCLHGIDKARFELPEYAGKLRNLGFFAEEPRIDSIAAFFNNGCHG